MESIRSWKADGCSADLKFFDFYGTTRCITVFTRTWYRILS